ncbi:pyroglutamyl-peptidase I [Lactobacillus hamsteri]|uniref:Pyrrolidone-carboxylate peptidase n=1 Tax=Lactobacillus hamsteri DSM 5661 = JCM 6256 TaxID=1423754 RepID=A0A0R1YD07_9LACO|nr:pyroglutamyl-peptidase I [Lactobacillus hamsteri]KRM37641.1 pyroglutamyl-peptidase I [Lactobacillus hamsteri DSM 5661 = JCM 6256]
MKILVTGFDPFDGEKINPAIEAVKRLPDTIKNAEIIKLEIPTVFNKCAEIVEKKIAEEKPDYVLNIGQAGGRAAITPERVAININDGRIPDNDGYQPLGEAIRENGDVAYFTQLPIRAEVKAVRDAGLPAEISNTAGTYVCNHIFYQVQYMRVKKFPNIKAGFIHIPFLPEQIVNRPNMPSMSLTDIVRGLTVAITAIVERDGEGDIIAVEGKTH